MVAPGRLHGRLELLHEARQVGVEVHRLDVVGGVEPAVDARDRRDAGLHLPERGLRGRVRDRVGLHVRQRRHQRQRIGHAVVDLPQHDLGPVARLPHRLFGPLLVPPQRFLSQSGVDRLAEKLAELALQVLPDVVHGPCLQGRHRDAAVLRAGDVDHRWRLRQGPDGGQDVEAGLAGHVMIEGDDVDVAPSETRESGIAVEGELHGVAPRREGALHEPPQAGVVVDVEDATAAAWHGLGHERVDFMGFRAPASPRRTARAAGWRWRSPRS